MQVRYFFDPIVMQAHMFEYLLQDVDHKIVFVLFDDVLLALIHSVFVEHTNSRYHQRINKYELMWYGT